ncbi:MAG: sigma-70 family RNA polymerase sigma factor [Tidjanibacter sp.]|nr:sigma-70 family RNA polymerase sigma factor [Tidjanibacter sp.]
MEIERYIVLADAQLVELSLGGDSIAFETLFNRYQSGIRNLCIQRTGNDDDADDLMQETFVKVFMNLDRYDPKYTFGQWIYTIARNTFIDYVRRRRDDLSIDFQPASSPSITPVATDETPEESIINAQHRMQIEQFLSQMPDNYRRLVELRFFKEYSYEEIADELNLPLGTVKTQIHRAREKLCKFITDNDIIS